MLLKLVQNNLKLSLPILLTRFIGMGSNLIAMLLMAKLGKEAIAASAIIMGIFSVSVLLLMSFSFSICALIAESVARQQFDRVGGILQSAFILNVILAIPLLIGFYFLNDILLWLHQPIIVSKLTCEYFKGVMIGYIPLLWGTVLEQFLIGINKPKYIVYLSLCSLLTMPLASYLLIFGVGGLPALDLFGAGIAASLTSMINLLLLAIIIVSNKWHCTYQLFKMEKFLDVIFIKKLFQLGWPLALQYSGELTAYILITLMMGWVGVIALAAQQIILQFTSIVIMIPASLSQATAVLVGKAYGQKNNRLIRLEVNVALMIVCCLMLFVAGIYYCFGEVLSRWYLGNQVAQNHEIVSLAVSMMMIAAVSQFFDGAKNVLCGAYRGVQATRISMIISTLGLWLLSIPLAYLLGFNFHLGAQGIRFGFTAGVIFTFIVLAFSWYRVQHVALDDELVWV